MSTVGVALRWVLIAATFTGGAFAVAACQGATGQPRDAAAGFMARSDAPSGYGLHFVDTGESAKLAYGKANSEVMSLMLECAKGSGAVEVSDVARGASRLTLQSGGVRSEFPGAIQPAPMAPIVLAKARADAPALKSFRETGRVEVVNGALRYDVTATRDEKPNVERFFAACDRAV